MAIAAIVAMFGLGLVGVLTRRNGGTLSTTTAPITPSAPVDDPANDGVLSESEYLMFVGFISAKGYSVLDRATAQEVGSIACVAARASQTQRQFAVASASALPSSIDPQEAGFDIGSLTTGMCRDEMIRLGFLSGSMPCQADRSVPRTGSAGTCCPDCGNQLMSSSSTV